MNCLDIITRAMRRIGIVAGGQLPRPEEAEDALETLKSLYRRLINQGSLGVIRDRHLDAGTSICGTPGTRYVASLARITLPDHAPDPSVICAVDPTTNQVDEYLFDGRLQKWITVDDLDLTSPAPLAHRDPAGLAAYLAIELADEYGQTPTEITLRAAASWLASVTQNWSAEDISAPGTYF
jgi:hypothetical protein